MVGRGRPRRAVTHSSVEEKKIEPQMDVKDADEEEDDGRADPARSADFPAEWRCCCAAEEKRKNSLRRKKVVRAGRGGPALPGVGFQFSVFSIYRESSLRRKKVIRAGRAGSALPGDNGRAWSASPRRLSRRMAVLLRCRREEEE
jgi:hypothetical protein